MKIKILVWVLLLSIWTSSLWAKDRSSYVDESYLKEVFTFKVNEKLKYAKCPWMYRGKLCYYIWGEKRPEDDLVQLPMPLGNQLRVTYEKNGTRAFDTFTKDKDKKDRSDVDFVKGLGEKAVWIKERQELIVLLKDKKLIGVHLNAPNQTNVKEKLIQIAKYILNKEQK